MMKDYTKILELLQRVWNPKYLIPICVTLGLVIFLPEEWLIRFKFLDLRNQYLPIVSISFLFFSSIVLFHWITFAFKWMRTKIKSKSLNAFRDALLHDLTPEEKEILKYYLVNNTKAVPVKPRIDSAFHDTMSWL